MGFFAEQGILALGSRFKALSDQLYDVADQVYRAHGSPMQARWFPVLVLLGERGPMVIGDLAREIGQTHSAVSQLAVKLAAAGLVRARRDRDDRRRRLLVLTAKGEAELRALRPLWQGIAQAVAQVADPELLACLEGFERTLAERSLGQLALERIAADARHRLRIVPWEPALREHFYTLNAEWLQKHFYIEHIDHEVLSDPERWILGNGGAIWFACLDDDVVGTCALLQESPGVFELTKMAVTERYQGLGIGRALLGHVLAEFRRRRGQTLFLESNSKLPNAIRLYASVGFEMQPTTRPDSHYSRADVYMIWRDPEANANATAA